MPAKRASRKTKQRRPGRGPGVVGDTRLATSLAVPRPVLERVYRFERYVNFANLANLTVAGILTQSADALILTTIGAGPHISYGTCSLAFVLADLPDAASFTALFDRYRVVSAHVLITPYPSQTMGGSGVTEVSGVIAHTAVDYDDNNAPTASDAGVNLLRSRESYMVNNMNSPKLGGTLTRALIPRVSIAVGIAAAANATVNSVQGAPGMWLDSANAGVQYYAWKAAFETFTGSTSNVSTYYMKAEYRLCMEFASSL